MTTQQAIQQKASIAQRCALVRREWSESERNRRRMLAKVAQESLLRRAQLNRRQLAIA